MFIFIHPCSLFDMKMQLKDCLLSVHFCKLSVNISVYSLANFLAVKIRPPVPFDIQKKIFSGTKDLCITHLVNIHAVTSFLFLPFSCASLLRKKCLEEVLKIHLLDQKLRVRRHIIININKQNINSSHTIQHTRKQQRPLFM